MAGSRMKRIVAGGFSLIELMVVVAVIAVIASIAYPSYRSQVQKSNRAQAKARLVQAGQLLERYYSDNNIYITTASFPTLFGLSNVNTVYSGPNNETNSPYVVTYTSTSSTYGLTATPQGPQTADTKCGNLTLNNVGVKNISGTGAITDCW